MAAMATVRRAAQGEPDMLTSPVAQEALAILLQLGERPDQAQDLLGRALKTFAQEPTTDALVQAVYKLKG